MLAALWNSVSSAGTAVSAGVLIGNISAAGTGPHVVGLVPTLSHAGPDEPALDLAKWGWVHSAIERYYRGHRAIGWYLSRPGHLAELDEPCLGLHGSYFPSGPAVLLLIDPQGGSATLHAGTDGGLTLIQRLQGDPAPMGTPSGIENTVRLSLTPVFVAAGVVAGVLLWLWAGLPGGTS